MKKKTVGIVAAGILGVGIIASATGQSDDGEAVATPTTTTTVEIVEETPEATEEATPSPTWSPEPQPAQNYGGYDTSEEYAFATTLEIAGINIPNPEYLKNLGEAVCTAKDTGATNEQIWASIEYGGWGEIDAVIITGAAIGSFCPEYL